MIFRLAALAVLAAGSMMAWHDPVHARITRAALESLPTGMQRQWASESERLIVRYSLYPDIYANAGPQDRARMKVYCEVAGRPIHNVTWKRPEDMSSLEYLLNNVVAAIRARDGAAGAQFAGTLAHLIEDSTCPAHALLPQDSPLNLMKELLPPPPEKRDIVLHSVIEHSSPEFDLGARVPEAVGTTVNNAAGALLDRIYAAIHANRGDLIELVRAVYADDERTVDRFRLKGARVGAEILADAYRTAFVLAERSSEPQR